MTITPMTRHEVIRRLEAHYTRKFGGRVWAGYENSKRAYYIRAEGLPAHPDMRARYPNGWSLLDYITPTRARQIATTVTTAEGYTYEPHIFDDGRVGYRIQHPNGATSWMYLNPSSESDDQRPNVFVYVGDNPDINNGIPVVYVEPYEAKS